MTRSLSAAGTATCAAPCSASHLKKIGNRDGAAHRGYRNPLVAHTSSAVDGMKPTSSTGAADRDESLTRRLEFYRWPQSAEGGIAGGATSSRQGSYASPQAGTPTFHAVSAEVTG